MSEGAATDSVQATTSVRESLRRFFALERDVLVLSGAMFAFSLGFQMTNRFLPEYMVALGATGLVVGLFGTFGNILSALYPYPGGAISDRIGSRFSLTLFGAISTAGFGIWLVAPQLGELHLLGLVLEPWIWVFVGLIFAQAWKSFGLGATFAVVKQATDPSRLAAGFASTETLRRIAFLVGPVLAAILIELHVDFVDGFQYVLAVAVIVGIAGTIVQHVLYDPTGDTIGDQFEGIEQVRQDIAAMPTALKPLLIGDTLVRFANGMVYVFFVLVVTRHLEVGIDWTLPAGLEVALSPAAFFGYLLGVEMLIALLVMGPAARISQSVGLKPVVAAGFAVYALFPIILINTPASTWVLILVFAFSGLRFAGLPAHKALIVGPAEQGAGGRVTGSYYLVRNTVVIPSGVVGGLLWDFASPEIAFTVASGIGIAGTGYFLLYGHEPALGTPA